MLNADDILLDDWADTTQQDLTGDWISMWFDDVSEDEKPKNESWEWTDKEETQDKKDLTSETDEEKSSSKEDETKSEEDQEDLDLTDLFKDLDSELEVSNESLDKIEASDQWSDMSSEIWLLRDSLKRMEDQIKKLNNSNADLKFKNAELEAFWMDDSNPQLLILSRNLKKAEAWDDRSKNKVTSILKEMLYTVTWEDFDETKANKWADLLSASEMYNNETNPNLKSSDKEEDWISL
jgi:hypothetical protein